MFVSTSASALRGPARSFLRRGGRSRRHHHSTTVMTGAATPFPSPPPGLSQDPYTASPAFSFGLIADIQYADADDANNFSGTVQRFYRHSLSTYQEAVRYWGTLQPAPACALVLGDMLDGKTAELKNQEVCINRILEASLAAPCPVYYCYGNHDHYTFGRPDIHDKVCQSPPPLPHPSFLCCGYHPHTPPPLLQLSPHWLERYVAEGSPAAPVGGICSATKLYYDWCGVIFVGSLDCPTCAALLTLRYRQTQPQVSGAPLALRVARLLRCVPHRRVVRAPQKGTLPLPPYPPPADNTREVLTHHSRYVPANQLAASLLAENNPNDLSAGGTWFNNLPFHKRRYVSCSSTSGLSPSVSPSPVPPDLPHPISPRWVPYNGGVGAEQVRWFHDVLAKSRDMGEKVCRPVFSCTLPHVLCRPEQFSRRYSSR